MLNVVLIRPALRRHTVVKQALVTLLVVILVIIFHSFTNSPVYADEPGYALAFSGQGEYVRLARTNVVMGGNDWTHTKTVSAWVKPTGAFSPAIPPEAGQIIISTDSLRWFGISRSTFNNQDRLWVWNIDANGVDRIPIDFTLDEWLHIALVHHNGTLSAYKNGILVQSIASGPNAVPGTADGTLFLGGSGRAGNQTYFAGQLDEVRFWNAPLDQATLAPWMNRDLAPDHPHWSALAAYYKMSDGAGVTLTDDGSHSHHGSLLGGMNDHSWVNSGAFFAPEPDITPTSTVEPTSSPEPSSTPDPTGTLEPTSTPEPTNTPEPTSTPDPTSTPESTPTEAPPANEPPVAHGQSVTLDEDTALTITLSGEDADNDPLTFRVIAQPSHGVLSGAPPALLYTPHADYHGVDSFSFVANDGHVDSSAALVEITILPVNDPPVAVNDNLVISLDMTNMLDVLANDYDVDGDPLVIVAVGAGDQGEVATDGEYIYYTPHAGFSGADVFTYSVADPSGATATAQVTVSDGQLGAAGYALAFDGVNDFVRIAPTLHILGPGWEATKTVTLWVKPTGPAETVSSGGPGWCDAILGDRPRWWGISHCVLQGYDRIWIWNYDGNYDLIGVEYTTNEWIHITLVHHNGQLTAYTNGVAMGAMPSGSTLQPDTGALPYLQLGGVINNANRNWTFQGELDEVRLWNIPRSEAQVQQDMFVHLAGDEPGLKAYYRMSDGEGTTLTDDGLYGWHGVLHDGLLPSVPPNGPIAWAPSGAFDQATIAGIEAEDASAQTARIGNTVLLTIEGEPDDELDPIPDQAPAPVQLFLPGVATD